MVEHIKGMLTNVKVEFIEAVLVKGYPGEVDFQLLDNLADEILQKHKVQSLI